MTLRAAKALGLLALAAASCADTGQERVAIPLALAGSAFDQPAIARGAVAIRFERAELAFGPLYLCAGEQAGASCETARAEWLASAVVDLLEPEPAVVGDIDAVSGTVRSYMYDLGLSSLLTREEPLTLPAAAELGGNSLVLEGQADLAAGPARFSVHLALGQNGRTELGVPIVRSSANDHFAHEIAPNDSGLVMQFDVRSLIGAVDFEQACAKAPAPRAGETRDCGELDPDGQGIRAIRLALSAGLRPEFHWDATGGE